MYPIYEFHKSNIYIYIYIYNYNYIYTYIFIYIYIYIYIYINYDATFSKSYNTSYDIINMKCVL